MIKGIYEKPTVNIFNDERLKTLPLISITSKDCPFSPRSVNLLLEVQAKAIKTRKKEGIGLGKEGVKLHLFTDYMI